MILQGYHLSGLARQMFWRTYRQHPLAQTYVALAVQHFVTYYQKTSPQKKSTARGDLCTAIILAVDSGKLKSIQTYYDYIAILLHSSCRKLSNSQPERNDKQGCY